MRALLDIRIGTMVRANAPDPAAYVRQIVEFGFESIEPFFWQTMNKDLPRLAQQIREAIGDADVTIDTLGMFGNPLEDGDLDRQTLAGWEALIDNAHHFGARTIAGFTGRVRGQPIEASLPQFKKVWGDLSRRAADKGVRLAFENCAMDGNWASGDWNIAHNPDAWELMFDAVPGRQSRARMGALPPARLSDRSAAADPQMGAESFSMCTAKTRLSAGMSFANMACSAKCRSSRCARRASATPTGRESSAS